MAERELYTAVLVSKRLLSDEAQCYHFEFSFERAAPSTIEAGQFLSLVAKSSEGKIFTRAYSVASAAGGAGSANGFALCVNRVPGGFFSNLLCDMREGDTVDCHGPHGLFTLRRPLTDCLWVAGGTGIAPMRGFAQQLMPVHGEDGTAGRQIYLLQLGPRAEEIFYGDEFAALAERYANFHYVPVTGPDAADDAWHAQLNQIAALLMGPPGQLGAEQGPPHAYLCGLAEIVKPARALLLAMGWAKAQLLFERYD